VGTTKCVAIAQDHLWTFGTGSGSVASRISGGPSINVVIAPIDPK
jgi:precorrin-6B methylase 2